MIESNLIWLTCPFFTLSMKIRSDLPLIICAITLLNSPVVYFLFFFLSWRGNFRLSSRFFPFIPILNIFHSAFSSLFTFCLFQHKFADTVFFYCCCFVFVFIFFFLNFFFFFFFFTISKLRFLLFRPKTRRKCTGNQLKIHPFVLKQHNLANDVHL